MVDSDRFLRATLLLAALWRADGMWSRFARGVEEQQPGVPGSTRIQQHGTFVLKPVRGRSSAPATRQQRELIALTSCRVFPGPSGVAPGAGQPQIRPGEGEPPIAGMSRDPID